jgi:hypothetical protein
LAEAAGGDAAVRPPVEDRAERPAVAVAILGFSSSLGVGTLALPLVAIAAGLDPATIGLLAAVSAVAQFSFRLALPWLLGRYADRELIAAACLMIATSYGLLIFTKLVPIFVLAQLFQGGARALFWTANQTHAVRGSRSSVGGLARVQVFANVGAMVAPTVAGLLSGFSLELALGLGVGLGLVGVVASRGMRRLPPFVRVRRREGERGIWTRSGVDLACWASFTAGGWRAMQGSYVPIVLTTAGIVPGVIGVLLSLSDLMATVAVGALIRFTPRNSRGAVEVSVVAVAIGLAVVPFVAGNAILAGACIGLAGLGYGMLTTIGPALASDSVGPEERGEALAVAGTFRAAALLVTPTGVAVGLSVVTLPVGLVAAGVLLAVPALAAGVRARLGQSMIGRA